MCMSMVASAFQYGWAPTLIPATTTLTSPPRWVCSTRRRSARGHPVEVLAAAVHRDLRRPTGQPLDRYVHLLGELDGTEDPQALGLGDRVHRPVGSPSRATRVIPSGSDAWCRYDADNDAGLVPPGHGRPARSGRRLSRSCSTNVPPSRCNVGTSSYG